MKDYVVSFRDKATEKLFLSFMKKLGQKAKLEEKHEMKWKFMPEDDEELERMMDEAEEDFKKGRNLLTAEQALNLVQKWQKRK